MKQHLPWLLWRTVLVLLVLAALVPLYDRSVARRQARQAVSSVRDLLDHAGQDGRRATKVTCPELEGASLLRLQRRWPALASWENVGGCGAGGGSSSGAAGGAKWIGRGVSGGVLDLQCLATMAYSHDNYFLTFNTRLGTSVLEKWVFGVSVPILYKIGDVDVLGQQKTASIAGFGDLSLEISHKLGLTNASLLTFSVSVPTGSSDAVRQGVVLPQHLQMGSGVPGASVELGHTIDRDWGLVVTGGSLSFGGWENSIGDFRSPGVTAFAHAGYILGPLVPSAGLTLFGKFIHDEERGADKPDEDDPLLLIIPNLALEWSADWLALLLYSSASFSYNGFEGISVTLGVSTSLF